MRGTPHVLEVGLFLIIGAELRAIQLARGRAPCIEILLERLPTVGATTGRILDREPADHNHDASPPCAKHWICSLPARSATPFVVGPVLMKALSFQRGANLLEK